MTHNRFPDSQLSVRRHSLLALDAAAAAVYDGLTIAHPELARQGRRRTSRRAIAARSVLRHIERLSAAIGRYQEASDQRCAPPSPVAPWLVQARVNIPTWWSPREADAVFEFVSSVAQAVWEAQEPAINPFDLPGALREEGPHQEQEKLPF